MGVTNRSIIICSVITAVSQGLVSDDSAPNSLTHCTPSRQPDTE